ncbi:hypothetical protein IFM89_037885 [Coptis chinensis]|uniref:BHLH domain-containing protein n=1 Tax=Coptis chinensis TaxID=261450 RepID=A0A835I081_9MAGN|nr:hypothetical protein IFM89_037885 [Coptis chinensis]
MGSLERVLERLRHLVGKNGWDYCVVWKLEDYPTSFIELMDCCCVGAKEVQVKEEEEMLHQLCLDTAFPHPKRTKACDALASLPSTIPLSIGIHGEVLVTGQPKWISCDEPLGTRALIPVIGGLVEFFAGRQVPKDQQMIELIMVQCNISLEQEPTVVSTDDNLKEQLLEGCMYDLPPLDDGNRNLPLRMIDQFFLEGSSTGSIHFEESLSFGSNPISACQRVVELDQSFGTTSPELVVESLGSIQPDHNGIIRQKKSSISHCGNNKECYMRRVEGDSRKSRNLVVERNRRNKLKTRLLTLRSLVPTITKMDIQSTLGDAISFIEELQKKVKALQDEVKDMEEEEGNENGELQFQKVAAKWKTEEYVTSHFSPSDISTEQLKHNQDSSIVNDLAQQMDEKVEVSQSGRNEFSLKLIFEQQRGWFRRLMEAMNALGLHVTEANIITVKGRVMNIFKAEAKTDDIQAQQLKDSLLKLIQNGLLMDKA